MVERNTQIDIVIPYYNDSDPKWKSIMYEYMKKEGSSDRQITGEERYRDWDCFKYFFRCIEKNCKWVNKIFLIVASESQIPTWINRDKVRVVLHNEYIPKELLPTFNIMTIENYICRIPDLSDNYVYCNDDYYFLNPTTAGMFFVDGYPVYRDNATEMKQFFSGGSDGTFYQILNNGMELQKKENSGNAKWYPLDHLPNSHKKNYEKEIIEKYDREFLNANSISKFRNRENYSNHVFICLYKDNKPYYKFNSYHNSYYLTVKEDTNFENHSNVDMICFNDTEQVSHQGFEQVKKRMVEFFEKRFPHKSKYEK